MKRVWRWVATGLLFAAVGCASPVQGLWPPGRGAPAHTIIVSVDTWHAMIAFPQVGVETPSPEASQVRQSAYEEWGYAEQAWYVEGHTGITGAIRALLWPSAGVVEVGSYDQVWSERTPQPPSERFTFRLSEQGYHRLRHYLRATKAARREPLVTTDGSVFYSATRSYHLFHQCHHYAARALREAGLPISTFWAITRGMFATQLRRAERIATEVAASRSNHSDAR